MTRTDTAARPSADTPPPLDRLNEMPAEEFAGAVGPLFEHAPAFLARLAADRPFASWSRLFDRAVEIALAMPEPDQVELIDSHSRLGAGPAATLAHSQLSYREQGYDRPAAFADGERVGAELTRLNDAYERRFGFRYVVFVAGRSRAELIPGMAAALDADRAAEIKRALGDVVAIARDRWPKLSSEAGS